MGKGLIERRNMHIDIAELIIKLISQWKAVVVFSLVIMLLMVTGTYCKDMLQYSRQIESRNADEKQITSTEEALEDVYNSLGTERSLIDLVLRQEKNLSEESDYFFKSLLMKENPNNVRVLKVQAMISCDSADVNDIKIQFQDYLKSDPFIQGLSASLNSEAEEQYIRELVYFDEYPSLNNSNDNNGVDESNILNLNIIVPQGADEEKVIEYTSQSIQNYKNNAHKTIKGIDISTVRNEIVTETIPELDETITSKVFNMNALNTQINTNKAAMTDLQKRAYETIKRITENDDAEPVSNEIVKPVIRKRLILGGAIIGLLLYTIVYFGLMLCNNKTKSPAEAAYYSNAQILGVVYFPDKKKGLKKLLNSEYISKCMHNVKATVEEQLDKISESIKARCQAGHISEITLINVQEKGMPTDMVFKLDSSLSRKIKTKVVTIDGATIESLLLNEKNVIFIAQDNNTSQMQLSRVSEVCQTFNINVLGTIYIQCI